MSIKLKFIILACITTVIMIGITYMGRYSSNKIYQFEQVEIFLVETKAQWFSLRKIEKNFIHQSTPDYIDAFDAKLLDLNETILSLQDALNAAGVDDSDIDLINAVLINYETFFMALNNVQAKIGFNPKDGLYGDLRKAVHRVESSIKLIDNNKLLVLMLQLRRNEKDFMLRQDSKYVDQFNHNLSLFSQELQQTNIPSSERIKIKNNLNNYASSFLKLNSAMQERGLSANLGMQGQMRESALTTESTLNKISLALKAVVKEEIGSITTFQNTILIVESAIFLAFLGFFTWLARSVLIPIGKLSDAMIKTANTKDLSIRARIKGNDEMSLACSAFNNMLDSFQNINQRIGSASGDVATATKRVSEIAVRSNESVQEQQQQTMQLSVVINEMTESIRSVVTSAGEAESAANVAHERCDNGKTLITETVTNMNQLSDQVKQAATLIHNLQEKGQSIGSVLDTIRSVADQTNLLALNAAIEAARAGEKGRGFAVVADEVRVLAARTQTATEEIQAMFLGFQQLSSDTVTEMDLSLAKTNECVTASHQVGLSIDEIVDTVNTISQMNAQIAAATEEQDTVCNEVNQTITEINSIAKVNAENSEESAETSEGLANLALELQHIGSVFNADTNKTKETNNDFISAIN